MGVVVQVEKRNGLVIPPASTDTVASTEPAEADPLGELIERLKSEHPSERTKAAGAIVKLSHEKLYLENGEQAVHALRKLLTDPDANARNNGIIALGALQRHIPYTEKGAVLQEIVGCLSDRDKRVAESAARTLLTLVDDRPHALTAVFLYAFRSTLKSGDPARIAQSLGWVEAIASTAKENAHEIAPLLKHHDPLVRVAAANVLEQMGAESKPFSSLLADVVKHTTDQSCRRELLRSLGTIDPAAASRFHLEALRHGSPSEVTTACNEIKRIAAHLPARGAVSLRAALTEQLASKNPRVIDESIDVLHHLGVRKDQLAGRLVGRLKEEDPDIRRVALSAVGDLSPRGAQRALQPVVAALRDPDSSVRTAAVDALAGIGRSAGAVPSISRAAVPALLESLNDESSLVRRRALTALEQLNGAAPGASSAAVLTAITRSLDDEDGRVRAQALSALSRFPITGSSERIGRIAVLAVSDSEPTAREAAIALLSSIGVTEEEALLSALEHPAATVRDGAARGFLANPELARKVPARFQQTMSRQLAAETDEAVRTVLIALSATQMAAPSPAEAARFANDDLLRGLEDRDPAVRGACATILGRKGSIESVTKLGEMLLDPERDVRKAAIEALNDIQKVSPRPLSELSAALIGALADSDSQLRFDAAFLVRKILPVPKEQLEPLSAGLLNLLRDEAILSRATALEALEQLGFVTDEILAAVAEACNDPESLVRTYAGATMKALKPGNR